MNAATLVTLAFALVAAWTAGLNFSTFARRPQARAHLWLGVAGLGLVLMGVSTALLYESESAETAVSIRIALAASSLPFFVGLFRFSEIFLDLSLRTVERIATSAIVISTALTAIPGVGYTRTPIVRMLVGFDLSYVDTEAMPFALLVSAGYLVLAAFLIWRHLRALPIELEERAPILIAVGLFACTLLNDVGVGVQLMHTPFLLVFGYAGLLLAFTAVLSRRFVLSAAQVEASAGLLQDAAVERTEALRQKDFQLAHGEALATIGTLAAGLAHEINNPLAFVTANLNHIEELRSEPESEAELLAVIDETQEGVERIRSIVDELLRLARRQEGGVEEVDLKSVVESVLPIVRHEARGRASLTIHLEDVPPVLGDRRLLGQIVLNLVLNAIHAIPEADCPGEVVIATTSNRPIVRLHVRDSGTGIPADVLPHIFEPFYTTKGSGKGTGLGLAITNQLVSRHHGRIHVDTGPTGTSMVVEFPRAGSAALASLPSESPQH